MHRVDYTGDNLGISGKKEGWVTIVVYKVKRSINIDNWLHDLIQNPEKYNLTKPQIIGKERISSYEVTKVKDFGGVLEYVFFQI